ncbi:MAG TPA: helix-turn-helix transcriptional regulator [Streptosporangiaceae bacterium]
MRVAVEVYATAPDLYEVGKMVEASSSTLGFFAAEVVRFRKVREMSQGQLAKLLSYSPSQVAKIETGERIPKRPLALKLDEIFETDGHFTRLQALVENTSVLPWFRDLYLVEGEAAELRTYESYLIPGLLQTESYARSALEAARPTLAPEDVDRGVAIRMTRQEIFDRARPPRAWFIIDESALMRVAASPATMRAQCEHLLTMGQRPEITIQVVESGQGICCAYGRAFVVLSFDSQGDLVYVEDIGSARYARKREEVDRYCLAFDHLRASALPDSKSAEVIRRLADDD